MTDQEHDPAVTILQAMREAGVDMNREMEFRFACNVTDIQKSYEIVSATRALGFDAAIEIFDDDHNFDPKFVRLRTDMMPCPLPLPARIAGHTLDLAAKIENSLKTLFAPADTSNLADEDEGEGDELIWISFVIFIKPSVEAIDEITDIWNAVLARHGAKCDGWEVDPNNMAALEAA